MGIFNKSNNEDLDAKEINLSSEDIVEDTVENEDTIIEDYNTAIDYIDDNFESNEVDFNDSIDILDDTTVDSNKNEYKDRMLYIVIDRCSPDLINYFRELGINVTRIYTDIDIANSDLMMQSEPIKLVIVDTGSGRFSAMGTRKKIVDLLESASMDDDTDSMKISVYYTDTVIKSSLEYSDSNMITNIHWHKYKSTSDIAANLLINIKKKVDNYIIDDYSRQEEVKVDSSILDFTGLSTTDKQKRTVDEADIGNATFTPEDITSHIEDDQDIEPYNIVI